MRLRVILVRALVALATGGLALFAAGGSRATASAAASPTITAATTSDRDPTFGVEGIAHLDMTAIEGSGNPRVVEDAEGRLIVVDSNTVVNYAGYVEEGKIVAHRFTPTGALDTSFGEQGMAVIDYGTAYESVSDMVLDASGRIVLAGKGYWGGYRWLVIRMNPDGTLDETFGSGGVVDFTPFENHASDYDSVSAVGIDAAGRIVVGGYARSPSRTSHVAFARLTDTGDFDPSFGGGGVVVTTGDIGLFASVAITVDSAGRFVTAVHPDGSDTVTVFRLDETGAGDATFGDGGIAEISSLGRSVDGLAEVGNGGVLVVQEGVPALSLSVRRLSPTGVMDTTYGDEGVFRFDAAGAGGVIVYGVVVDSVDRAAVYGDWYSYGDLDQFVVRVTPDGSLDTSFSGDGFSIVDGFPGGTRGSDSTTDAIVDTTGRIVTAGSSWNGLHDEDEVTYLTLTRYLPQADGPVAPDLCFGWLPTIWGTDGDDTLVGTPGDDVIAGGNGSDIIRGVEGNDVLCGGDGDDEVYGGSGYDLLEGNGGNDLLRGGPGDDASYGGDGDDRIQAGPGADVLWGGAGKDKLWGGIGADQLFGEGGRDQLHGNRDDDYLNGGDDTDRLWGDAGDDRLYGVANSDFLYGGIGHDLLKGGDGNDRLFGWTGDDDLYGEAGRDQLRGQDGADYVNGGPHHDWCSVETEWIDCESPL